MWQNCTLYMTHMNHQESYPCLDLRWGTTLMCSYFWPSGIMNCMLLLFYSKIFYNHIYEQQQTVRSQLLERNILKNDWSRLNSFNEALTNILNVSPPTTDLKKSARPKKIHVLQKLKCFFLSLHSSLLYILF